MEGSEMQCTLQEDKKHSGQFRVEAIDEDGGCEVAIFAGPNALDRAIYFAAGIGAPYYDGWSDPEDWGREPKSIPVKITFEKALSALRQGRRIRCDTWPAGDHLRFDGEKVVHSNKEPGNRLARVEVLVADILRNEWVIL